MYPKEMWVAHRDEVKPLGVEFSAVLNDGEEISSITEVKAYDGAGVDQSEHIVGVSEIADFTARNGTTYANAAVHFWKTAAVDDEQPIGSYPVEIEVVTSEGRTLVALLRARTFPVLLIVDGLP